MSNKKLNLFRKRRLRNRNKIKRTQFNISDLEGKNALTKVTNIKITKTIDSGPATPQILLG